MNVKINGQVTETDAATLEAQANKLQLPETGVAVAVNGKMVTRRDWKNFVLSENDEILVIKAACGG